MLRLRPAWAALAAQLCKLMDTLDIPRVAKHRHIFAAKEKYGAWVSTVSLFDVLGFSRYKHPTIFSLQRCEVSCDHYHSWTSFFHFLRHSFTFLKRDFITFSHGAGLFPTGKPL